MEKRIILILLLGVLVSNCAEEPVEHSRPPSGNDYVPLSVGEAREYFESHAECLEGLYFREKPSTKSTDWKLQLSPRWEDAAVRTLDSSSMVELPLSSNAWLIAKRNIVKGESRASDVTTGFRKLVIRERKNGSMQQFVITVIPTGKKSGWFVAHPEKFNFWGGEGFYGYVFCSTLEGKFTGVYEYVDGVRYRRHLELNAEIPAQTKGAAEEYPEEEEHATISMFNAPMEDSDNIPESPDGEKPGGCNHHDVYDPNCPYCLDDAPVIGSVCHECGKAVCVCCSFCGRYPCQCPPPDPGIFPEPVPCRYCNDIHCDGECYIHGGPSQGDDDEEEKKKCPYGQCDGNPCTCCAICGGPCQSATCPICKGKHCNTIHDDCDDVSTESRNTANQAWNNFKTAKKIDSTAMTYAEFIQKWNAQNTIEHAIALNKKWDTEKNGFVSILEYYNSGINNEVNHDTDQMTEAIIHTHPASTDASETNLLPPSAKDLQNLLEISSERHETDPTRFKCMHFTSSIVIANGYTFALTVTDREKAEQFLKNNPDFVNENAGFKEESAIGIIYNNTYKYLSSTYQGTDLEAYTLAHTLQEMDTGISLAWSKGNDGAFRSIRTMKDNENKNVIFIIYCS